MKEGYNETEDQVKSFLVTNECILLYYIKTIVWFCIYYTRYMFSLIYNCSWYEFRIRNCTNMAKICFGKYSRDVTILLHQSTPTRRIMHTYILIRLICRRNPRYPCGIKVKVVPFSVSHTWVIQTFLSQGLKDACIIW